MKPPFALSAILTAALIGAPAAPAAAQDMEFRIDATLSCLAGADGFGEQRACIGTAANACMDNNFGGHSTVGTSTCLDLERQYWDDRLNDVYGKLRAREKAEDVKYAESPGWMNKANALRDMQRAWIPYRDATCDYERAQWGGGTGGGPAAVSCHMYLTAEQALYLESMLTAY